MELITNLKKKAEVTRISELCTELITALEDLQSDKDIGRIEVLGETINSVLEISILRIKVLRRRLNKLVTKMPRARRKK